MISKYNLVLQYLKKNNINRQHVLLYVSYDDVDIIGFGITSTDGGYFIRKSDIIRTDGKNIFFC